MNSRVLLRIGAVAAIVGALFQVVATITEISVSSVASEAMREIADSGFFAGNRVLDLIGALLTLIALAIVGTTFRDGVAREWSRVGQTVLAVALASGFAAIVLGIAVYEVAQAGVAAEAAEQAGYVAAVDALGYAVGAMFIAAFLSIGIYLGTLSAAILSSDQYPRWIGWTSAAGGALLVAGILGTIAIAEAMFLIALLGFLLWMITVVALGLNLWKQADAAPVDASSLASPEQARHAPAA